MSAHSAFGPKPWLQTNWDWRAAGNFMAGGAGAGLLLMSALLAGDITSSIWHPNWIIFSGLALIGLGLLCVWLEIGRPLRALHVFFNPRTSWMTREAFVAGILFPVGLLALLGVTASAALLALLAAAFLYCQSRMLPAARGIPAWRPTLLTPLMFATGLCEGAGVLLLLLPPPITPTALVALAVLVLARFVLWSMYRQSVDGSLAAGARRALGAAARALLLAGTLTPLLLLALAALLDAALAARLAGVTAALAGVYFKFVLITRASYNQGFALKQLPVRGVRTSTHAFAPTEFVNSNKETK